MSPDLSMLSPSTRASFLIKLGRRLVTRLSIVALCTGTMACGPKIGDPCENAYECAPLTRDRYCDASYMVGSKGECTIWGCAQGGCPDEAACVTVFPTVFLSQRCDPKASGVRCGVDEICLPDGICADARLGRASCRLICEKDEDCREGYRCMTTGKMGLYVSPKPGAFVWDGVGASICVPK